jgi:hypothetical protein
LAQVLVVALEIAQQDDVVFVTAVVPNGAKRLGQQIQFSRCTVRIGLDVQ